MGRVGEKKKSTEMGIRQAVWRRVKTDSRQNGLVWPQVSNLARTKAWLLSMKGRKMNTVIILIN